MSISKLRPIILPLQYYTLVDWLEEMHIATTDDNVTALGQLIGTSLRSFLKKILNYCRTTKTVSNVQVFTALKSVFGGKVPLRAIQQSRFRCNLPSSSFFTCVKLMTDSVEPRMAKSLRWSKDAKIYSQRALEWHIRECLENAKVKAKTYWQSTEEVCRYLK